MGQRIADGGYAAIGIDYREEESDATERIALEGLTPLDASDGQTFVLPAPAARPVALAKVGRAILRLRLYWNWSQKELERRSGVDQTTISRLERGLQRGLSIRRLGRILDALYVGEVVFEKPRTVRQTDLEIMLFGDRWERAVKEADRRLGW